MPDLILEIQSAAPRKLAALLELTMTPGGVWRHEELRAILKWHLNDPQALHPGAWSCSNSSLGQDFISAEKENNKTIQELFKASNTPLKVLRQVKEFAKAQVEHPASSWPADISRMIYYVAIAAALARHRARITRMSTRQILQAFQWALTQPWITPWIRELLTESVQILESRRSI